MRKACLVVQNIYKKNEIFNKSSILNFDNCLNFFHVLEDEFYKSDIVIKTDDIISIKDADFVIYNEMPSKLPRPTDKHKSFLLIFECEVIRPDNWISKSHEAFLKVFTWSTELVGRKNYYHFNFNHIAEFDFIPFAQKKYFCTLIASNKQVRHSLELYSKRIEAIRWFEHNKPTEFKFYGHGWAIHTFATPLKSINRILNRIKTLRKFFSKSWPGYSGPVQSKIKTLKNYKFSICFENAKDINGYITEKIFDSMAAGCIPVYWGAPDILKFVPEKCYILFTQFKDFQQMYDYLNQMTETDYNLRQQEIHNYLISDQHKIFEPAYNAKLVIENIINDKNK